MSPRHLTLIKQPEWYTKITVPIESKKKIVRLIQAGKYEYFTNFAQQAIEEKLERELKKLKYKGKRNAT